jgi:hypothetical protein
MTRKSGAVERAPVRTRPLDRVVDLLDKRFYLFMSLLIAAVVVYGFSHTIDRGLIHAVPVRPMLLSVHAAVFSGWVVFLIVQSALVQLRQVSLHRFLGWFGVVLGAMIPVLGASTAITMARFKVHYFHSTDEASGLMFSIFDMMAFTIPFALAIYWRRKPELHRRLVLIASAALTSAAFARFPPAVLPAGWFYPAVDGLVLLGAVRDLVVNGRIHRVYLYALPAFCVGQAIVMYTADWPYWLRIGNAILG